MLNIPDSLKYSLTHSWLDTQTDGTIRVGITDPAQARLGEILFVELPRSGHTYASGEECGVLETINKNRDIFCPVDGKVIDVNHALEENPELINIDPYQSGWLFIIRPQADLTGDELLNAEEYSKLIDQD